MKPFHVTIHEDLPAFLKLCDAVSASRSPQPVFFADGDGPRSHFFLATELFRAHLELVAMHSPAKVIEAIEKKLHVVRASVRQWSDESPVFLAPLDSDKFAF